MTLSRKKSRSIHVDGQDFRWTIAIDGGLLALAVELDARGSRRMVTYTPLEPSLSYWHVYPDLDEMNNNAIEPGQVAEVIRWALSLGWDPSAGGSPIEFDLSAEGELQYRGAS